MSLGSVRQMTLAAIFFIFLRFYYFSCDFYCQAWEFSAAVCRRQSGRDNQIGHNLCPAVLQSTKLQFQIGKYSKWKPARTRDTDRVSDLDQSAVKAETWTTGRGVILNWTEWFSVIINERRFLIESSEIFLGSRLWFNQSDSWRCCPRSGTGSKIQVRNIGINSFKFGEFSLEKVTDINWLKLVSDDRQHEAERQRHN